MTGAVPTVSVCIPAYNRERVVGEAINSVLSQDFADFELIIVDDGSTDATLGEVAKIGDARIRIEANGRNLGIPAARQRCLELARGRYLAWLDSDDVMCPKRLSRQVSWLDRHPETATLGGWVRTFHDNGKAGKLLVKPLRHDHLAAWLLFRCCHANTTLMGRTETLRQFGFRAEYPVSEDYDLSVRLTRVHRVANLPCVFTRQRQHVARTTALHPDRSFSAKGKLAKAQLDRLGLSPSEDDLDRHHALTRMTRADVEAPLFAARGRDWLSRISAANRRSGIYDQAALNDVLQAIWAQACMKIMKVKGPAEGIARYRSFDIGSLSRLLARNFMKSTGAGDIRIVTVADAR